MNQELVFYTDEDFTRLQQILLLKFLGFSLNDIKNMTIGDMDYHFCQIRWKYN